MFWRKMSIISVETGKMIFVVIKRLEREGEEREDESKERKGFSELERMCKTWK